ncbi:cysteine desulfurase activator complex subunit SufB [Caballeronia terrestris]|uniref:Cysteine desulfurase activator complex subunit SufB n=1 Tax=Caballeronia terrestris TaxID=1226301 RepID=A0A158KPX6_9BURK|nr:Fe-S cluster assembly protein SufD [Caballeronia terrestris]SAL82481.1 cysteine desulfurase activator complex subunit SufB [Caballeronia terrestris]
MSVTALEHYIAEFTRVEAILPGRRLPWLTRARKEALAHFAQAGFPTRRQEEWKYTSVAALKSSRFAVAPEHPDDGPTAAVGVQSETLALPDTHLLVFVNGRHQPQWSRLGALPSGVTLTSLAAALEREPERLEDLICRRAHNYPSGFAALHAAFMADGAYIRLGAGAALGKPIHLLFLATEPGLVTHQYNVVIADAGSRVAIVEHHVGTYGLAYSTNTLTEIIAAHDAQVEHHKLQQESLKAFHIAGVNVDQQHGSRFASSSFALGGELARIDINVGLNAERSECTLDGLYMTGDRQHVDHHTRIDHTKPRGKSREFYKGVLAGASRAVFNGKVVVHPDAQQTDAHQSNHNLLLSENAEVDTKPQLEIYADDVKCSHGATVGQLDADQIYYLRSRGVDDLSARALLTFAFARDVVERLSLSPLRSRLEKLLLGQLPEQVRELL